MKDMGVHNNWSINNMRNTHQEVLSLKLLGTYCYLIYN